MKLKQRAHLCKLTLNMCGEGYAQCWTDMLVVYVGGEIEKTNWVVFVIQH